MRSKSTRAGELTADLERSELTRAGGLATEVVVELAMEVVVELAAASESTGATTALAAAEATVGSERTGVSGSAMGLEAERAPGSELAGESRSVTGVEVKSMTVSLAWVLSREPTIDVMSLGDIGPVEFFGTE